MFKQFELEPGSPSHSIEHGLGTTALLVNVWQNGYSVTPSIRIIDENTLAVYNMFEGGTLVIAAADPEPAQAPKATSKTSRSKKTSGEEEGKRSGSTTRRTRKEGSGA